MMETTTSTLCSLESDGTQRITDMQPPITNRDPGPWTELSYKDGIKEVSMPTFEAFFQFLNVGFGGSTDHSLLWRGQRSAKWEIVSSLARDVKSDLGHEHILRYCSAVARCTNEEYDVKNSEEEQERLWAIGQHHGLKTPLIDWTIYPYVALFFAFAEKGPEADCDSDRSVFAINFQEVATLNFMISQTHGLSPFKEKLQSPPYTDEFKRYILDEIGVPEAGASMVLQSKLTDVVKEWLCKKEHERLKKKHLKCYTPSTRENQRIHSQGGKLVYTHDNVSIEKWIRTHNALRPSPWDQIPLLTKIIIPGAERKAILRGLNNMNINYLTLFPDLDGAAKHCNLLLLEGRELGLKPT